MGLFYSLIARARITTICGALLHITKRRASRGVQDGQHTAKTFPLSRIDVRTIEGKSVGDSAGDGLLPTADICEEFGRVERNIDTRWHWKMRIGGLSAVHICICVSVPVRDSCY